MLNIMVVAGYLSARTGFASCNGSGSIKMMRLIASAVSTNC
jgi:hypothetical protein